MPGREGLVLPSPPVPEAATSWALFLDVDGTLLEFAPTPDAVHVPSGLIALLLRLQHRLDGALALISGRRIASLDNLFKPLTLPAAGLHGFERRDARGVVHLAPIADDFVAALHRLAQHIAARFPGVLVEDKQFSIAFHYGALITGADSEAGAVQALQASLAAAADRLGCELLAGHKVYELKSAVVDKGRALVAFMDEPPFQGRLPIFIGDDFTDAYALRAASACAGMAIQVDERIAGAAQFALSDPAAVLQWLQRWEEQFVDGH